MFRNSHQYGVRQFRLGSVYLLMLAMVLSLLAGSADAEESRPPKPPVPPSMPEPPDAPNQSVMHEGNTTTYHVVSNTLYDENGQEVFLEGGYELIMEVTFHPGEEPPPPGEGEPKDPFPTPEPIPVTRMEPGLSLVSLAPATRLMQARGRIYDQDSVNCRVGQGGLSAGVIGPGSTVKAWWTLLLYTASYPYYATHQTPGTSTKCDFNAIGYCSYQQAFVNRSSIAEPWINHLGG
jgi:hypothetical protein